MSSRSFEIHVRQEAIFVMPDYPVCFWKPVSLDAPTKCQLGNPITGITNPSLLYTKSHYYELGS